MSEIYTRVFIALMKGTKVLTLGAVARAQAFENVHALINVTESIRKAAGDPYN